MCWCCLCCGSGDGGWVNDSGDGSGDGGSVVGGGDDYGGGDGCVGCVVGGDGGAVLVVMPLMVGDDVIDCDVGVIIVVEAPLAGAPASVWQCGYTPLYFCQIKKKNHLNLPEYIFLNNQR